MCLNSFLRIITLKRRCQWEVEIIIGATNAGQVVFLGAFVCYFGNQNVQTVEEKIT